MLGINQITLKIRSAFAALSTVRATFVLWLDNGTGGINTPWNDLDTWSE